MTKRQRAIRYNFGLAFVVIRSAVGVACMASLGFVNPTVRVTALVTVLAISIVANAGSVVVDVINHRILTAILYEGGRRTLGWRDEMQLCDFTEIRNWLMRAVALAIFILLLPWVFRAAKNLRAFPLDLKKTHRNN